MPKYRIPIPKPTIVIPDKRREMLEEEMEKEMEEEIERQVRKRIYQNRGGSKKSRNVGSRGYFRRP